MRRRVFKGDGSRHAAIAHARVCRHAHVTAHNYRGSKAVFYTTHPETRLSPREFVNGDRNLPCAHMYEVLDEEQAHRVYFDVDDEDMTMSPEDLLRQSAQGLLDWLNHDFGEHLVSTDLYVSSKCRPDKTSFHVVVHMKLRGRHARRRFKVLLKAAQARDLRLGKVDLSPYQSTQMLSMIGCSKGTKPGYPKTPVPSIPGMQFAASTQRRDHLIAVDAADEPLLGHPDHVPSSEPPTAQRRVARRRVGAVPRGNEGGPLVDELVRLLRERGDTTSTFRCMVGEDAAYFMNNGQGRPCGCVEDNFLLIVKDNCSVYDHCFGEDCECVYAGDVHLPWQRGVELDELYGSLVRPGARPVLRHVLHHALQYCGPADRKRLACAAAD